MNARAGSNETSTVTRFQAVVAHQAAAPAIAATPPAHRSSAVRPHAVARNATATAMPIAIRRRSGVSVGQDPDDSVGTGTSRRTSRRISSAVRSRIRASVVGTIRCAKTGWARSFTSSGRT